LRVHVSSKLRAVTVGAGAKASVSSGIATDGFVEIVGFAVVGLFVSVLAFDAGLAEVKIAEAWKKFVTDDRDDRGQPDVNLAALVFRGEDDGARGDFRLVDRRHRLRLVWQFVAAPINCGVFSAGICTITETLLLLKWISSARSKSMKPWIACLLAQ
jgi:hypothetical protein